MSESRDARLSALGFDISRQQLARAYRWRRIAMGLARILIYIGLSLWLLSGFTFTVKAWASTFGEGVPQYALYAAFAYFLYWLPVIPLGVLGGFLMERRYGISVQGFRSWLGDAAKGLVFGLSFSVLAIAFAYTLLAATPDRWWLYAWIVGLAVGATFAWLGPVVIAPLFFKFEPLADEELVRRLKALADRAGTRVVGVFRMGASSKTTKAIGGLAGLGNTRRIIVSDTLLSRYSVDEVEAVIAHELGHHVHRDAARLAVAGAVATLIGLLAVDRALQAAVPVLNLDGVSDIAGLPLFGLTLAATTFVFAPLLNAVSRRREAKADAFAIRMTGNPGAFSSTMLKIHDQNLGVADPHPLIEFLFHDHPSGRRRVEFADRERP